MASICAVIFQIVRKNMQLNLEENPLSLSLAELSESTTSKKGGRVSRKERSSQRRQKQTPNTSPNITSFNTENPQKERSKRKSKRRERENKRPFSTKGSESKQQQRLEALSSRLSQRATQSRNLLKASSSQSLKTSTRGQKSIQGSSYKGSKTQMSEVMDGASPLTPLPNSVILKRSSKQSSQEMTLFFSNVNGGTTTKNQKLRKQSRVLSISMVFLHAFLMSITATLISIDKENVVNATLKTTRKSLDLAFSPHDP